MPRAARGLLAGVCLLIAAGIASLAFAGRWLQGGAVPVAGADVAIVLAGSYDRALYAADLYKAGKVQRVAVSRPAPEPVHKRLAVLGIPVTSEDETARLILVRSGVPDANIDVLPGEALNTRDEAAAIERYLSGSKKRIIVVASPYSRRRTEWIISRRVAADRLQVVATPYEEYDWRWWRSPDSARAVAVELMKMLYLAFSQKAPA